MSGSVLLLALAFCCSVSAVTFRESSIVSKIDSRWAANPKTGDVTQMEMSYRGGYIAWIDNQKRLFTLGFFKNARILEATATGVGDNVISFKMADKYSNKLVFLTEDPTTNKRALWGMTLKGESIDRISDATHDVKDYIIEQHDDLADNSLDRHVLYTTSLDGGATYRLFQTWYTDDTNIVEIPFPGTASSITQFASFTRWNNVVTVGSSGNSKRRLERWYYVADGKLYGIDNDDGSTIAQGPFEASMGKELWVPAGPIAPGTTPSFTFTFEFTTGRSGWVVFKDTSEILWASSISEETTLCISDCANDRKYVRQISQNAAGGNITKFTRTHWQHRLMFIGDLETKGKSELFHTEWCYGSTCTIDPQTKISGTHTVVDFAPLRSEIGAAVFLDDNGALWAGRIGGDVPVRVDNNNGPVNWFDTAQSAWIYRSNWGPDKRRIETRHMRRVFWRTTQGNNDNLYSAQYSKGVVDELVDLSAPLTARGRYSRMTISANGEQLQFTTQPGNGSSARPVLYTVAANGGDVVQIFPDFDAARDRYSFSADFHSVAMVRSTGEVELNKSAASQTALSAVLFVLILIALF